VLAAFFMSPSSFKRRTIGTLVLVACTTHVSCIGFYMVGSSEKPWTIYDTSLGNTAKAYAIPLFEQNWHLFSPNPATTEYQTHIRYQKFGEEWGEWHWVQEDLIEKHHAYRFSTHGKLLYIFMALERDLIKSYQQILQERTDNNSNELLLGSHRELGNKVIQSAAGKHLQRYCVNAFPEDEDMLEQFQIRIRTIYPIDYTDYEKGNQDLRSVIDLTFPVILARDER
jgi:hypothetical protein